MTQTSISAQPLHFRHLVDFWLALAEAKLGHSSWLGWRRNHIEGYVPYFNQIPGFFSNCHRAGSLTGAGLTCVHP